MQPVIDRFDRDHVVLATPLTIVWYLKNPTPEMNAYDPIPANLLSTPRNIVRQLTFLKRVWTQEVRGRELATDLNDFFQREWGINSPRAIQHTVSQIYQADVFRRILVGIQIENSIERFGSKQVTTGTGSMLGRAILNAAERRGCTPYYIPHSVTAGHFAPIQSERIRFFPGTLAEHHLRKSVPDVGSQEEFDNMKPAGRPYLTDLRSWVDSNNPGEDIDDRLRVVIGTQTYDDSVRERFVSLAIAGLGRLDVPVRAIIKVHPGEDPEFYSDVKGTDSVTVTVTDANLWAELGAADLLLTVNSNIGIEAVLAGTPCVCINLWEPFILDMLYARHGPFPVLESEESVETFFSELRVEDLDSILNDEKAFVNKYFVLEEDTVQNVVDEMYRDLDERAH